MGVIPPNGFEKRNEFGRRPFDSAEDRREVRPVGGPAENESSDSVESAVAGVLGVESRGSRDRLRSRDVTRDKGMREESGDELDSAGRGRPTPLLIGEAVSKYPALGEEPSGI